jgi:hypothetical protein
MIETRMIEAIIIGMKSENAPGVLSKLQGTTAEY